ncbi:MAG: T9SS type A sorting domain-containing protein [candidate division Zixibacteria bacterium]
MQKLYILILIFIGFIGLPVSATIINIPDDYETIQEGIDISSDGDTVLVAPGVYYENVQMAEGVSLFGSGMENTIIDGGGLNDVIKALDIDDFVIEGFTIRNSNQGGSSPGNIGIFMNPISSYGTKIVRNCYIHDNGHGIDIWNDFGGILYVEYNIISDNIYDGFDPYLGTTYLTNNTIIGNGRDGYHDWAGGGSVYIKNNIFAENGRYGIFKHRDTPVFISYNDVWNNVLGDYYQGYSGQPTPFTPYPGSGEISEDPLFSDRGNGDFHLLPDSPCIDAGDPDSPFDPDGTRADMGTFYFDQSTGIDEEYLLPGGFIVQNYPNPFNASTVIGYSLPNPANVTVDIYDILGRRIETLVQGEQRAGYHQVVWDAEDNSSGMYFYRIQAGEYVETRKMVLLK